jgi:DNA repair protein RadC
MARFLSSESVDGRPREKRGVEEDPQAAKGLATPLRPETQKHDVPLVDLHVERVRVLYLDTRNRLMLDHHAHEGTVDEAAIHPREVIRRGLDIGASALILVHNHPSGNPEPSRADIQITQRIAEAGRHLGLTVHDHVIVGREGHVSLRAKGLI